MTDTSGVDPGSFDPTGGGGFDPGSFFSSLGSGISNLFSGGSGLSDLASQAFGGGGSGQSAATQTDVSSANQSVIDPSTSAQTAITDGQSAPANTQNQDPQGQSKNQGQNQQAPQTAIDALKKALTNLRQQQRQNPWQLGQGGPNTGQNASYLNRAARIPTGAVPPAPIQPALDPFQASANLPSADATNMAMNYLNTGAEGAGGQSEYGFEIPGKGYQEGDSYQPEYGPDSIKPEVQGPQRPEVQGPNAPYPEGDSYQPEYGPGRPTPQLPPPGGQTGVGQLVQRMFGAPQPIEGLPPPGDPSSLIPPVGPWAVGRGIYNGLRTAPALFPPVTPDAKSPPAQPMTPPRTPTPQGEKGYRPEDDPSFQKPGVTKAPDTGKPVQHVDPKTKKPVDPKTGEKLPTKKTDLPTKKGHYEPATGDARDKRWVPDSGHGPIMRDVAGMQGVPQMLGQLAQMAMPLLMSGILGGGFGGGRHGRHGGFGFGGRHGGFGGRHGGFMGHPGYGRPGFGGRPGFTTGPWRGYRGQPSNLAFAGGGIQPGGGGGATGNPQLDQLLASLGLGGNQNQQGNQQGGGQRYGQGNHFGDQGGNPWQTGGSPEQVGTSGAIPGVSASDVDAYTRQVAEQNGIDPETASKFLSVESSYGQATHAGDEGTSFGPFQLHFAPDGKALGDQFRRDTGLDPRDPSTWKAQIDYALKKAAQGGWGPWTTTMNKLGLNQWSGINRNFAKGTTPTGGSTSPNPQGSSPLTAPDNWAGA